MSLMFWRKGQVPEPIYNALPFIYLMAGIWVFAEGEGIMSVVSGMLLCAAGGLVILWRRDARARQPGVRSATP